MGPKKVAHLRGMQSQTSESLVGPASIPPTEQPQNPPIPSLEKNSKSTTLDELVMQEGQVEELLDNEDSNEELKQSIDELQRKRDALKAGVVKRKVINKIAQIKEAE